MLRCVSGPILGREVVPEGLRVLEAALGAWVSNRPGPGGPGRARGVPSGAFKTIPPVHDQEGSDGGGSGAAGGGGGG